MTQPTGEPRIVEVGFQSWAGLTWHRAELVGETPKRYRVRWLNHPSSKDIALVPKHAVRFPGDSQS